MFAALRIKEASGGQGGGLRKPRKRLLSYFDIPSLIRVCSPLFGSGLIPALALKGGFGYKIPKAKPAGK